MLQTILTIFATLVPSILQNTGVIGAGTSTLITNLTNPILSLINTIKSGSTTTQDYLAALAALSGAIAVLKAETNLPASVLTEVNDLDIDVQAAIKAYMTAENGLNLAQYTIIATVS